MPIIIRMDIDRPYGHKNLLRKTLSRLSADLYFPKYGRAGYLMELFQILDLLNVKKIRSHIFFRRSTLPQQAQLQLLIKGKHIMGMHLENSRSYQTFQKELIFIQNRFGLPVVSFSKHGSGHHKYGLLHYPPYEPDKYVIWGQKAE